MSTPSTSADLIEASLNEVETLVAKAARGAGLAWGVAEEAGQSARWLAERGLAWSDSVLAVIDPKLFPVSAGTSPLLIGAWLEDTALSHIGSGARTVAGLACPIWICPALARAAVVLGCFCELTFGLHRVVLAPNHEIIGRAGLDELASIAQADVTVAMLPSHAGREAHSRVNRTRVPRQNWEALEVLALKTYVPSSAQSRARGAGAGLQDND